MDAQTVVGFFRFLRENPKAAHDKKAYVKLLNKAGDEAFKVRKARLHKMIAEQKKNLIDCFDIYEGYVSETGFDPATAGEDEIMKFIDEVIKRMGIEQPKEEAPDEQQD